MTVYFVRRKNDPTGYIKIGFTRGTVERRLRDMASATPGGFDVLAEIEGGPVVERSLHNLFEADRVDGEWFRPSPGLLAAIADAGAGNALAIVDQIVEKQRLAHPVPEDEFSDNIVRETRFYLNELVKREWRGMGDSVEAARDRLMARLGLHSNQGARLWNRAEDMKDVPGETYRCLWLAYCLSAEADGTIADETRARLNFYRKDCARRGRPLVFANGNPVTEGPVATAAGVASSPPGEAAQSGGAQ
jgi:hypothetical protein